MEKWTSIEPGVWRPQNKGDEIIGTLINKEPRDENAGISSRYYIDTDHKTFLVWGSAIIEDRMKFVKLGQKVKITYEGKTKNKRNQEVNLFKVEVAQTDTTPEVTPDLKFEH